MRRYYPDELAVDVAARLGRSLSTVYQKAVKLGIGKSDAFKASETSGRVARGRQNPNMIASRFQLGQPAWNKGTKGIVGVQEACRATQFKKGEMSGAAQHNYVPIGTLRISKDGYLERKVTDDPSLVPTRRWTAVHRLMWEATNGPIPTGHALVFKPGRKTTEEAAITADSVELVTRAELMRRNSYHTNYPPEVRALVQLKGAIRRQVNRIAKETS
ncbi:MAG TPA: hypothetical protein VFF19_01235 [Reyranella sp.]|nr:hypothetical protein [Reyranella sp.]